MIRWSATNRKSKRVDAWGRQEKGDDGGVSSISCDVKCGRTRLKARGCGKCSRSALWQRWASQW